MKTMHAPSTDAVAGRRRSRSCSRCFHVKFERDNGGGSSHGNRDGISTACTRFVSWAGAQDARFYIPPESIPSLTNLFSYSVQRNTLMFPQEQLNEFLLYTYGHNRSTGFCNSLLSLPYFLNIMRWSSVVPKAFLGRLCEEGISWCYQDNLRLHHRHC